MRNLILVVWMISAGTLAGCGTGPASLTAPFSGEQAKVAQEAWAKSLGKPTPTELNVIGMEMVLIPPGRFTMGSPDTEESHRPDESQVDVTLTKAFYLGKTEVTQGQWRLIMGTRPWRGKPQVLEGDNCAATYVSWKDAKTFCRKLSDREKLPYRLPTEAEWEFACRAGTTTRYSFGDEVGSLSNYGWWGGGFKPQGNAKEEQYAHEVGCKLANPFGLHDMHGNVWEWCEDMCGDRLPGGVDPLNSVSSEKWELRVLRGGGWYYFAAHCGSAPRLSLSPTSKSRSEGFRVACDAGP